MRITLFHATLPQPGRKLGGVEVVVHRLATEFARRPAHEVVVLSTGFSPEAAPYEHHRIAIPRQVGRGHPGRLVTLPILLNTVRFPPSDVLHLHGDDWFFLRRRIPTVRTMHGSALREAQSAKTAKRRALQFALYPMERLSSLLADVTLAVGPDSVRLYPGASLIDNGVDPEQFHPGPKANVPTVLFVGGWNSRKRGHLVQAAFQEQVQPRFPDAELIMVSDHADPAPGVRHLPHVSDSELAVLYRSAWVFAYPSQYEGFGLPYLEAMASGTAVLATPNSGAEHVLGGGRWGRIVPDGQFAEALLTLVLNDAARAALVQTGLERANQLSWSAVADQHLQHYERAVQVHARKRRGQV